MADEDKKKPSSARKTAGKRAAASAAGRTGARKTGGQRTSQKTNKAKAEESVNRANQKASPQNEAPQKAVTDKVWRLLAMVAFGLIGYFVLIAYLVLAAMQYIVVLATDSANPELKSFMGRLKDYMEEIFEFLAYERESMPFPFNPFPEADQD